MPVVLDQFDSYAKERKIVFQIESQGSQTLTLPATEGLNFLIQANEPFTIEKPYQILSVEASKQVDNLQLSDGVNTIYYSQFWHEEADSFSIIPDSTVSLTKKIFNSLKKFVIEPHTLQAETRIRSANLASFGIGANPTITWNFKYQISFLFKI